MNSIQDRFQQPGYEIYRNLEQLLLKASERLDVTTEFNYVTSFYRDDFQKESLRAQLMSFGIEFQRTFVQSEGKDKHTIWTSKSFSLPYPVPREIF